MMWPYPKNLKLKLIRRARYNKETNCLEWTGNIRSGYGRFQFWFPTLCCYKDLQPHKAMLELKLGRPVKWNMESIHVCDNRICISTARGHVKEGTHIDNMSYMRIGGIGYYKRQDKKHEKK